MLDCPSLCKSAEDEPGAFMEWVSSGGKQVSSAKRVFDRDSLDDLAIGEIFGDEFGAFGR